MKNLKKKKKKENENWSENYRKVRQENYWYKKV